APPKNLKPGRPAPFDLVRNAFSRRQAGQIQAGGFMNGQSSRRPHRRGGPTKTPPLFLLAPGKVLLTPLQPPPPRYGRYLVEMDPFRARGVALAAPRPRSPGHALQFAGPDDRAVAHAVFVFQRPVEDVGDDLHVPVAVHPEALTGLHAVVVDDPQGTK